MTFKEKCVTPFFIEVKLAGILSSFNKNVDHTNYKFREKIVCFILHFDSVFSETCR